MLFRSAQLWKRGADFLGCPISILAGAMSWVSERHLVAAISNAGGFGVIACGAMTPALLDTEIKATLALTKRPFGVNLITMHPQLMELVDVCQGNGVTHVVFAGGVPPGDAIKQAKTFAKVLCFAPAVVLAKRLIKNGADPKITNADGDTPLMVGGPTRRRRKVSSAWFESIEVMV